MTLSVKEDEALDPADVGVLGPQAASIIQPLVQAMQFDQRADDVARQVFYIHPALTEVIENALLDALG